MRIGAMILRILRQFIHDKRTMALMFIAPLIVLSLMSLVFSGKEYHPNIGVVSQASSLSTAMEKLGAKVLIYNTEPLATQALDNRDIDALITLKETIPQVLIEGSDPSINKSVQLLLEKSMNQVSTTQVQFKPEISFLHGSLDMAVIDRFGPIMIGVFIFFFVFLIAGISFLRERTTGTLERLLSTPIKRWEIVIGYVGGFGIFTLIQALLISFFSIKVLGIMMVGNFGYVLLITILLSMTALTLGMLLSAFASNELQMMQFIPLIIVPQIFLSGLLPLNTLPLWLQKIGYVMPIYYGADAMIDVMIRGKGWSHISTDLYILLLFSLIFSTLNILALRKHRTM
ncbi:ABC transporter permease [Paenibacillus macquariensis]|uniref:ABC-2 type transport system permease protein n=1 Tax=Paenibacillus macquariensis TaxID=948756 RepID=A0ABY1JU59_9BACL|nr:ABC transporter permease [Paenibacillus macquariensis]MEC0093079.1 ABC transporter permease [Paenibacillus macquariensis]OAB36425.1 ABC transporter permease [Paenibacillus macquariensis subsp. macquariensis]SIQ72204.1 ABC-2 type transport system permease protein [Paenibacillus macquariensis]